MKKLFGTDGIRAVAGHHPLDFLSVYALGKALVGLLRNKGLEPDILIGRDTRESGVWIERALVQGIRAGRGRALSAGVITTSAISFLTLKHKYSAGVVISASHNPYQDNGIKIFSSEGMKIADDWEVALEKAIHEQKEVTAANHIPLRTRRSLVDEYIEFLTGQIDPLPSSRGLKVVLDCSNGAGSSIAPRVLAAVGCRVAVIHNGPDGRNINHACGSLHPHDLTHHVIKEQADIGIAYDGDADRALWVDERGRILNGDHTLFVQSRFMKARGRLSADTVVATTMSNMGLEVALQRERIKLYRTRVGDKYVLEQMIALGANLGGEQSGHTIFLDSCPTGDGILTSLKMIEAIVAADAPLSKLVQGFEEFPQILTNVRVSRKADFAEFPEIIGVMAEIKRQLGGAGRLDVRYSGTEPVARVMVEGRDRAEIEALAQRMSAAIAKYLGTDQAI